MVSWSPKAGQTTQSPWLGEELGFPLGHWGDMEGSRSGRGRIHFEL